MTTTTTPAPPVGDRRLFAAPGPGLTDHLAAFGPLPRGEHLADLVDQAGLAGRGGAAFPTGRKLRGVAATGRGVVVGNAAEGEPSSHKDHLLLLAAPHLVLDGLVLTSRAVGAREAYVVVARADLVTHVRAAVAERDDRLSITVVQVPDRFVSGQESALVSAINGGPGLPLDKGVPVFQRGVHRRPTLVHNVETLAHVALLARFGPAWFRSTGTEAEPGTFLATVSGAVPSANVFEVPFGTPLSRLLRWAGASHHDAQAVLVGGFHGAWVPGHAVAGTDMTRASLQAYGATVGAGVVVVLGHDRCGLVESARVATYLARQSAGQCGPCVNGLPRMADALTRLADRRRDPRLVAEIARLRPLVVGRGACAHPDGTARFVASTMQTFADEVALHLGGGCRVDTATPAR